MLATAVGGVISTFTSWLLNSCVLFVVKLAYKWAAGLKHALYLLAQNPNIQVINLQLML